MQPVIELENVYFSYGESPVLRDVTLKVEEEEFLGVIGPNAGGKTTLIKIMLGLLKPAQGRVLIMGQEPDKVRNKIGYVAQRPSFNRNFPITARDAIMFGRMGVTRLVGGYSNHDKQKTSEVMQVLELDHIANKQLNTLSGGQLQRVWIARALAGDPEILILDEPTANIDLRAEEDIFALLKQYNSHMTIIVVSHDIAFISSYVHRVACLNQTLICHDIESISGKTVEELYGIDVKMIHHVH